MLHILFLHTFLMILELFSRFSEIYVLPEGILANNRIITTIQNINIYTLDCQQYIITLQQIQSTYVYIRVLSIRSDARHISDFWVRSRTHCTYESSCGSTFFQINTKSDDMFYFAILRMFCFGGQ